MKTHVMKAMKVSFSFLMVCAVFTCTAQTPRLSLEAGYGTSLKVGAIKTLLKLKDDLNVEGSSVVAFGADYRLDDHWSLGVNMTTQSLSGSYTFMTEVNQVEITDTLTFDYGRWALVLEPRFFYPIKSEHLQIYSAVRVGYKREKLSAETSNNTVNEVLKLTDLLIGRGPNISVTPVAIQFFPMPNFGVGASVNVGPTYLARAQVIVRF